MKGINDMFKKIICGLFAISMLAMTPNFITYAAVNGATVYVQAEKGYLIRQGGINSIDGVKCQSKEETIELEIGLRSAGYIQVSGKNMDITEEEFNLFCVGELAAISYSEYANKENEFNWNFFKIYVDKNCYADAMEQIKAGNRINATTKSELGTSTVVINYSEWYQKERIGQVVQEFNNNIPSWVTSTGFLQITSPIDIVISLEDYSTHTINNFYVRANKLLLVKVREGAYIVKEVNSTTIPEIEEVLPYKNNIQIQESNTEDNPYILDLEKTVDKYEITSIDLSGKPDHSYQASENNSDTIDIDSENAVVSTSNVDEKTEKSNSSIKFIIIIGASLIACIVLFVIYKKKK